MSRIRANQITNQAADGAPTVQHGLIISGVTTVTTLDLNGDIDVDGHTNLDNVSVSGISTFSGISQFANTINLTHASAGQNYIYFNEDLQFAKNGTGTRLKIDSSGKVNIGNTGSSWVGPLSIGSGASGQAQVLQLYSNSDTYGAIFFGDADSGAGRYVGAINYYHDNNYMRFDTAGSERLRISSGGDMGIGDNNPNIRLTVVDSGTENLVRLGRSDGNSHGSHTVNIKASKDFYHNFKVEASSYQLHTYDGSAMSEKLRIASDGEVFMGDGLGDNNRSTLLSISGAYQEATGAWAQMGLYSSDSYAQNKGGSLVFGGQDGVTSKQYFAGIAGVKENTTSGNYAGVMKFYIRPAGSTPVERLRIDSGGNLKFNSGYGSVNTAYGVRAWIAFKAASNANITRGSGNATMTDHGTGDFTMNFTTAMPDAAYCVVGSAGYNSGQIVLGLTGSGTHSSPQTNGFRFTIRANYNNSSLMDEEYINLMVVR